MSEAFEVAQIDALDAVPVVGGTLTWRPVRRRFGIEAFGVNVFTADNEGDLVVEDHYEHEGPEELYVVLRGRATFTLGDDEVDAPAGTLVFVRAGTRRAATASEPGTAVLGAGAKRGEVFEPSGWEWGAVAFAELDRGNVAEARRVLDEGIARDPEHWAGLYNLACLEARTGRTEEALAALRRSVEREPDRVRPFAAEDDDLAPLRDDPRFQELVGA